MIKKIDTITNVQTNESVKAHNFDLKAKPVKESFWNKEVRLFRAEMAGWSIPKADKKVLKQSQKKAEQEKTANGELADLKHHSKPLKIFLGVMAAFLLTLAFMILTFSASVFAYRHQFQTKAFYGTRILGQEVGGKNLAEVRDLILNRTESISLSFNVDGQTINVKPVEAGVAFNPDSTAIAALRKGKQGEWYTPWLNSAESLFYKISPGLAKKVSPNVSDNLQLQYTIDDQKLSALTQNLSQSFNVQSKNAGLVMKGTDVQVIPAIYGRQIMTDSIKTQIAESVKSAQTANIAVEVSKVNPDIVEADTQKSIEAAKVIINQPVSYTYQGKTFTPDKAMVGSWIVFNTQKVDGKDQLVPSVDSKLVWPYIYSLGTKINVAAVNKKVTVKNGGEQTVEQEGKNGLAVDADAASTSSAKLLSSGKSVSMELPTYVVKAKTTVNNIVVADWAKYIDINLSAQKMCAYLAGGNQQGCWSITSGATAKGYYTPTGTFLIQRKVYVTSMPNPPSPYPLTNIHYVSYFTSAGHAIHEAWWRSSFGGNPAWNGSHGCVNAPISVAQWIYNWAPIGTPVIIHY